MSGHKPWSEISAKVRADPERRARIEQREQATEEVICLTGRTANTTINYRRFFHELLEAIPWPVLIVDRTLFVSYYNQHAARLLEAAEPLKDLTLDQVKHDAA